jgi:class 3 adenylate cyclase/predicted ATPase
MICPRCSAESPSGQKFCGECGTALAIVCPSCGTASSAGQKFCGECGTALAVAARPGLAAAVAAGPLAERRVCSVLFCDLVGFTPLSESRDPEAVRELLSGYFDRARTVVTRYGGVVEKFIGDAVMAVWGTPVAAEGDAERAVRAGLDLVAAVAELGAQAEVPGLAARCGVVTGEVAVTLGASGEGMVAGDAVNTAARVQAAAGPGVVLVDAPTQRLAGAGVGFAGAGEHVLRGKAEPQVLWRAVRVLAGVGGSQRVDGLEAPLIGRDAELRMVRELFHAAAGRRVPRLVLVSGPAGVGKSRLGWEVRKYLDGLAETVWWHQGRCLSYGEGVAFWALAEMVRQRLGIGEEDPADVAAARLAEGLDGLIANPAERAYVGVRLGRLLGVGSADGAAALSREELFAGWRVFFERLAVQDPVVLLVEDAQYADAGLLDFLDYLIDWVRDLPVYVLVLARPELGQARPGFGTGRNRTALTLDPLDTASMDQLADALVPGMPPAARAKITAQAQGIPLFAVETVRSLIDRDIVQPIEGVYRLTGDVGDLAVPDSLHALLASRLDALDPPVRRLLADAAVLGATFSAEALIAVSGQDEAIVRVALAELVRREVLAVSADPLSPERGSYGFTQNMLRQVAYDTLSRRDRKARHLKVAAHLRTAFPGEGEEVTEVIARHYLDALDAVPDDGDAGQIRGQAIAALTRAADRAGRTGAPAQAAASYAAAARLTQADTQNVGSAAAEALWEHAAEASFTNADYPTSVEQADQAADAYRQRGDARSAARAQTIAGRALRQWGRHAQARERLTAALTVLREEPGTDTVRALDQLARLEVFAGSPAADALSAEALALGQDLAVDEATLADLFTTRGISHAFTARNPEAASYFREAVRLAGQAGDPVQLGRALLNLSDTVSGTDPVAGAEAARAAAAQLRRVGARNHLAYAAMNLAQALLMTGDWDAAGAELAQAADADGLAGIEFVACYRAWLAALRGDIPAAQAGLAGLGDLRASEDHQDQANIAAAEAFTAAALGQPAAALRHAHTVLDNADALGISAEQLRWSWPLAARAAYELADTAATRDLLALLDGYPPGQLAPMQRAERDLVRARLAAADGNPGAGAAFAAAITALRQHSTPYHLAHGLLDHAEYLLRRDDDEAAGAAISEACDIAGRLRCAPLLDRAELLRRSQTPAH